MQDISGNRSLRERWSDYRPTKTQTFWIAVGGIVATLIIGFGPGGWVTGGTAQELVSDAASSARHELATAVCVEEFMHAAGAGAQLEKLQKANFYERDELVAAGGWATMPDRNEPNTGVASMCASKLAEGNVPAAEGAQPSAAKTSTAAAQ